MATRKVRKTKPSQTADDAPTAHPGRSGGGWGAVVQGTVEIDVENTYAQLDHSWRQRPKTLPEIVEAMEDCANNLMLAIKLKHKARFDYEMDKHDYEAWLEEKKTEALLELENEKANGVFKKQITESMITGRVSTNHPQEFRDKKLELQRFRATVHSLEEWTKAFEARQRSLLGKKDAAMMRSRM